ncbi:MAG: type II secretion system protein F [Lachnospiraceae bacterium]|nr:type II secretion system protein F [Lachnospiraceae bacterium]
METYREDWQKKPLWYRFESLKQQVWHVSREVTPADVGIGLGIAVFFSFFFYRSAWAFPPMLLVGGIFVYWSIQKKKRKRQQLYLEQFKECVLSVLGAIRAGYAVENAFAESIMDMEIMYGKDCWIAKEVRIICRGVRNNKTLEGALADLGRKSGLAEICEFAEVFTIAKRNSGNIPETIELYSKVISEHLELIGELETLLAAKRLEQKVMNVMPFLIVLYLEYTNRGYFDMMYHNLTGVAIMTGCLVVYLAAYALAEKIFNKTFG